MLFNKVAVSLGKRRGECVTNLRFYNRENEVNVTVRDEVVKNLVNLANPQMFVLVDTLNESVYGPYNSREEANDAMEDMSLEDMSGGKVWVRELSRSY